MVTDMIVDSQDKYVSTLLAGYTVWPLVHVINFRFIPSSQRVLYINCVQASPSTSPLCVPPCGRLLVTCVAAAHCKRL